MVIYRRARATLYPLALYCVSGAIGGYFVWHAVNGERGLKTKEEYEHKIAALRDELEGLKSEHALWNHRIALLSGRAIDRDLLDEEARAVLGRVQPERSCCIPGADAKVNRAIERSARVAITTLDIVASLYPSRPGLTRPSRLLCRPWLGVRLNPGNLWVGFTGFCRRLFSNLVEHLLTA